MSSYEKWSLILTVLTTLITIGAASYIGWIQNSINQKLVDISYEPSLTVEYIKPVFEGSETGLKLKNKGKSNIYVYAQSVSDPNILDSQRVFLINPNPGVLAPGDQFDLKMNSIISSSTDFMQTIADLMYAGKGSDFLIRVAFMTPDKQKYLLDTKVTIKTKNEVATVLFEGSQIRKFNWGEED